MKKANWLIAVSVAAMITTSGIALAATAQDQPEKPKMGRFASFDQANGEHGKMHGKAHFTALLEVLKIDEETFKSELKAGKTLAQIAGERGIEEKQLVDILANQMTEKIDEAVTAGRMPAEKAETMKANMAERIAKMVKEDPQQMRKIDTTELQQLLNMDQQALREQLKSGKSLLEIAGEKGISKDQLLAVVTQMTARHIDQAVADGRIPADKAETMKAKAAERAEKFISHKPSKDHNTQ